MLVPSLAVAGPLINAFALEGYAVAIRSPLEGRRTVRQQAACGYDFIKVWNVVSRPVFDAVAEQAHLEGMDLVGHVPQGIPIRHAAESGMRTMEHLKGFINDQTLKRGETDYSAAVSPNVWNTPTLYAGRDYARGAEAQGYLAASSAQQFVPPASDTNISTALTPNAARIKELIAKLEVPFHPSVIEWRVTNTSKGVK